MSLKFRGMPVVVSNLLPNTKLVTWRTERKWAHRLMWNRKVSHRVRMKQVPCETVIVMQGKLVCSQVVYDRLLKEQLPT